MRELRFREVQSFVKGPTGTGTQNEVYLEPNLAPLITNNAVSQGVEMLCPLGLGLGTAAKEA